jgi:ketosteroid isomerase-like protein
LLAAVFDDMIQKDFPMKATPEQITLGRSLFDAFAADDLDTWQSKLAHDFTFGYPGLRNGTGAAAAREFNTPFNAAFSDWTTVVHTAAMDGDTILMRLTVSFTHSKPLALPEGLLDSSGARCDVDVAMVVKMRDGKIVREETLWNVAELVDQIKSAR